MASFAPGMTPTNSPQAFHRAFDSPVFVNCLNHILTATRMESAIASQHRTDRQLVEPDAAFQQFTGQLPDQGQHSQNVLLHNLEFLTLREWD